MNRRSYLATGAAMLSVAVAGCEDLPVSDGNSATSPTDAGTETHQDASNNPDSGESGTEPPTIDAGPPRLETTDGDTYPVVPLTVSNGYPGMVTLELSILDGDTVVESRETMLPIAPPDLPIEVQFLPLEQSATDARLDDITDPAGDYPPIDVLTVTEVSVPEHVGPTSDNGITARVEYTGSGTVEFTPIVALLDGETIVKVLGFTGPETATVAAGETYRLEQPVVLPPPGGFDGAVVYPVAPIFE